MPITKTGRYSMNPAYAEALDRAAAEAHNATNAKNSAEDGDDTSDDSSASDGDDAASTPGAKRAGEKTSQNNRPVKRIEIEPAENGGFVSRTQRQQPDDGDPALRDGDGGSASRFHRDGWAPPYDEPELRAHPDAAHLLNFLSRALAN